MDKKENPVNKFINVFHKIEEMALVFFLSLMIVLTFSQIILRTFFRAVEWFDSIVKYSVLWVGMIAAGIATFRNKHIKIDIIGRFSKGRVKSVILVLTNLFASIVSIILAYASLIYIIQIEMSSTDPSPFLNIPKWCLFTILPIGFGLMGIRFFIRVVKKSVNFIKNKEEEEGLE